jgi:hypothetical protein
MAKIVFGMNQSLDGYVDHDAHEAFVPNPVLFRHFIEQGRGRRCLRPPPVRDHELLG